MIIDAEVSGALEGPNIAGARPLLSVTLKAGLKGPNPAPVPSALVLLIPTDGFVLSIAILSKLGLLARLNVLRMNGFWRGDIDGDEGPEIDAEAEEEGNG